MIYAQRIVLVKDKFFLVIQDTNPVLAPEDDEFVFLKREAVIIFVTVCP